MRPTALLFALMLVATPVRAEWIDLTLPTGETLKADLAVPADARRAAAVIYLHGRTVREEGYEDAADIGYDVAAFSRAFADAGFVALSPVRRTPAISETGDEAVDEGISATLAAIEFLRTRPEVDPQRIAVVGYAEGALIALWAVSRMPDLHAGVIMSPARMTSSRATAETQNFDLFMESRAVSTIRAPLLVTVGENEPRGIRRRADSLTKALMTSYKRFRYIHTYPGDSRWFRQPQDEVIADIAAFLRARHR